MTSRQNKNDHFLRPSFTEYLIQRLQRGDSVNLYGESGIGKTRLLEDILNADLKDILVIYISFKGYQNSYKGFCEAVCSKTGLKGNPPENLNQIIEELKKQGKQIFLFIDDFKYFPNNTEIDTAYNQSFIDSLNSVKNTAGVSLAVVTEKPINNFIIFISKQPLLSALNLTPLKIEPLQHKELVNEINRRFKGILKQKEKTLLASCLNQMTNNYEVMKYYEFKILTKADAGLSFDKRVDKWHNNFEKERCQTGIKNIVKIGNSLKCWYHVLLPDKLANMIKSVTDFIKGIMK